MRGFNRLESVDWLNVFINRKTPNFQLFPVHSHTPSEMAHTHSAAYHDVLVGLLNPGAVPVA